MSDPRWDEVLAASDHGLVKSSSIIGAVTTLLGAAIVPFVGSACCRRGLIVANLWVWLGAAIVTIVYFKCCAAASSVPTEESYTPLRTRAVVSVPKAKNRPQRERKEAVPADPPVQKKEEKKPSPAPAQAQQPQPVTDAPMVSPRSAREEDEPRDGATCSCGPLTPRRKAGADAPRMQSPTGGREDESPSNGKSSSSGTWKPPSFASNWTTGTMFAPFKLRVDGNGNGREEQSPDSARVKPLREAARSAEDTQQNGSPAQRKGKKKAANADKNSSSKADNATQQPTSLEFGPPIGKTMNTHELALDKHLKREAQQAELEAHLQKYGVCGRMWSRCRSVQPAEDELILEIPELGPNGEFDNVPAEHGVYDEESSLRFARWGLAAVLFALFFAYLAFVTHIAVTRARHDGNGEEDNTEVPTLAPTAAPLRRDACRSKDGCKWEVEDWGECSSFCGIGHVSRNVICRHGPASACDATGSKPPQTKACQMYDGCIWHLGQWGSCSSACGHGNRTREVWCSSGNVSDCRNKDADSDIPATHVACREDIGCGWTLGEWSACSAQCGTGKQHRSVECKGGKDGSGSTSCSNESSETRRKWSIRPCHGVESCRWQEHPWSNCSSNCGRGIRSRTVSCENGDLSDCQRMGGGLALEEDCHDMTGCADVDRGASSVTDSQREVGELEVTPACLCGAGDPGLEATGMLNALSGWIASFACWHAIAHRLRAGNCGIDQSILSPLSILLAGFSALALSHALGCGAVECTEVARKILMASSWLTVGLVGLATWVSFVFGLGRQLHGGLSRGAWSCLGLGFIILSGVALSSLLGTLFELLIYQLSQSGRFLYLVLVPVALLLVLLLLAVLLQSCISRCAVLPSPGGSTRISL